MSRTHLYKLLIEAKSCFIGSAAIAVFACAT